MVQNSIVPAGLRQALDVARAPNERGAAGQEAAEAGAASHGQACTPGWAESPLAPNL